LPAHVTVRIGGVPYGVGAPLLCGLAEDPDVEFVPAAPTRLIAQLREHRLDAALVSSIEAIRRPGYTVAPGLGIACRREVRSVRAFRRPGPIRSVGLDCSSATSAALLRLLLQGPLRAEVGGVPTFTAIAPTLTPAALPHDLVLLIGDHGLNAAAGDREVWDLGAQWHAWTGLPFVFAVWLLRPGVDAARIVPLLRAARERGRRLGAPDGTHGAVHYDLDDDDERGRQRFYAAVRAAGLDRDDAAQAAALEGAIDERQERQEPRATVRRP
jgi:chorismate dehydratase